MNAKATAKPAPLGRGLSALFGDTDASFRPAPVASHAAKASNAPADAPGAAPGIRMVPITWVQPGTYQPRRHFDQAAIDELSESIRERGVLQPLMVRPLKGARDQYEIVAGERRWRAAQKAGVHEVPVLVRDMTDQDAMEIGLIENVQRQDLSPLEEAEGYRRLLDEFHHTQDGLAKVVGKSRPHITNLLRLLSLPDGVKKMIDDGALTMGHARTLVTAKNPLMLAQEIVKKGLSVRQAEALARKESDGKNAKKKAAPQNAASNPDILAIEKELERIVGLKAKLQTNGAAGSLTFFYQDLDQLDGLLKILKTA